MTANNSPKENLKTRAYNALKEKIVSCEYKPGSMLNEAQLAAELNFSRTPIREAISILEMEGFLRIVPKKGILVADILLSDVVQIFQARMEIEPITLKLAGPRLPKEELEKWLHLFQTHESSVEHGYQTDTNMHLFIIRHCGNSYYHNSSSGGSNIGKYLIKQHDEWSSLYGIKEIQGRFPASGHMRAHFCSSLFIIFL